MVRRSVWCSAPVCTFRMGDFECGRRARGRDARRRGGFSSRVCPTSRSWSNDFRGSYFPHCGVEHQGLLRGLKSFAPDLVLTHCRHDLHQDHRITTSCTWNTFRDHAILEYEIPKFDGDIGVPNVLFALTRRRCSASATC